MTREEMEERLKAARERRAAAEARMELSEEEALEAELRAEELRAADAEAIAAAEASHGRDRIAVHHTPMGAVIVKRPSAMHFRRFSSLTKVGPDDAERLVQTCLVHPSRSAFDAIADELPAVPVDVAALCVDLARGERPEVSGKS